MKYNYNHTEIVYDCGLGFRVCLLYVLSIYIFLNSCLLTVTSKETLGSKMWLDWFSRLQSNIYLSNILAVTWVY